MTQRQRIAPRSDFERDIGFTRALRAGDRIIVSGTIDDHRPALPTAGEQADRVFQLIGEYIAELGGKMEDLVRVRMFVTDIADADAVSAAFAKHCKCACPTGTLVAISALYDPAIKVEIEAEAVVAG